jgi:hypothetical protein
MMHPRMLREAERLAADRAKTSLTSSGSRHDEHNRATGFLQSGLLSLSVGKCGCATCTRYSGIGAGVEGAALSLRLAQRLDFLILVLDLLSYLRKFCVNQQQRICTNKIVAIMEVFAEHVHHTPSLSGVVYARAEPVVFAG